MKPKDNGPLNISVSAAEDAGYITIAQAAARMSMSEQRFLTWMGRHGIEKYGDRVKLRDIHAKRDEIRDRKKR